MKPSEKSPEMEGFLEAMTTSAYGRGRKDSIESDTCVTCGRKADTFRDGLSKKEFSISGMCQQCQDSVF
jgi:hypothetical protein